MEKLDIFNTDLTDYYTSPYDESAFKGSLALGLSIPEKILIPKDIQRTKFREVYAYSSENKAFFRVINNYFQQNYKLNDNAFAYRKGISISTPISKAFDYKRKGFYLLKVDLSKYFNSVNVQYICDTIIPRLFTGDKTIDYMRNIFHNRKCKFKSSIVEEDLGIQPGNPFSSFLANYILDELDMYMTSRVEGYIRYSDDILIAGISEDEVKDYLDILSNKLNEIGLKLNPDKVEISSPSQPTKFLGVILTKDSIGLSDNKKKTFKTTIKHYVKKYLGKDYKTMPFEDKVKCCYTEVINALFSGLRENNLYSGIGGFIINNVDCTQDYKELNDYLIQEFKVLKTGKHNKKTWTITSLKELTQYGFLDWFHIVKFYKLNKYFFAEYIYRLYFENIVSKRNYNTCNKTQCDKNLTGDTQEIEINSSDDLCSFIFGIILNTRSYSELEINPIEGVISFGDIKIMNNFKIKINDFDLPIVSLQGQGIMLHLKIKKMDVEAFSVDYDFLFNLYKGYCLQDKRYNSKVQMNKYIRPTLNDEYLTSKLPVLKRILLFNTYLLLCYSQLKDKEQFTVLKSKLDNSYLIL